MENSAKNQAADPNYKIPIGLEADTLLNRRQQSAPHLDSPLEQSDDNADSGLTC